MKHVKVLFFIFLILTVCIGYIITTNENHTAGKYNNTTINKSSTIRELSPNAPNNSFGIATYQNFDASIPLYATQYTNGDQFNGYLEIMNSYNTSKQFLVMAVLDYRIIPFNYNNNISKTHLLNVSSKKGHIYPFNIMGISSGYHDLLILSIENPFDYYINLTFTNPQTNNSSSVKVWYRFPSICNSRFNIINENANKPSLVYNDNMNQNISFNNSEGIIDGIYLSKESSSNNVSRNIWMYENASENETIQYYIKVANSRRENMSYAIIQMLDDVQIPINDNGSDYVYYGYLKQNQINSIPATIKVQGSKGIHELLVLIVTDPYENIEIVPGKLNPDIEGSVDALRAGINVT